MTNDEKYALEVIKEWKEMFQPLTIPNKYEKHTLKVVKDIKKGDKMSNEGIKHDDGKPRMDLLPYDALIEIAKVLTFGAKKYTAGNWAKGINYSRLIAAAERHLGEFKEGRDIDKESGIGHLAHAACNLIFAIWMSKHRPERDDRWIHEAKATSLIKET